MTAADSGRPDQDLYHLLGVPREASREDIMRAWRRRARAEHPDSRPARRDEDEIRLAILAGLYLRYLTQDRDWPW
jgi:hypothetical protein